MKCAPALETAALNTDIHGREMTFCTTSFFFFFFFLRLKIFNLIVCLPGTKKTEKCMREQGTMFKTGQSGAFLDRVNEKKIM